MPPSGYSNALIVGAGPGLGAALARQFLREGMRVAVAARDAEKLSGLFAETDVGAFACDATDGAQVKQLFEMVEARIGSPDVVVYNAGSRVQGPSMGWRLSKFATLWTQPRSGRTGRTGSRAPHAATDFWRHLLTGASASVKGFASPHHSRSASSPFAGSPRAWRASSRPRAFTSHIL